MKRKLAVMSLVVLLIFLLSYLKPDVESTLEKKETETSEIISAPKKILLTVPFINQNDESSLENGCEVTALAMLLNYYQIGVTKNELADAIEKEPLWDGLYQGNPNLGFVGNMVAGNEAMGVHVAPIAQLAEKYIAADMTLNSSQTRDLADLLIQVEKGQPVWSLVTLDFSIPTEKDFQRWETKEGPLQVTPLIHACVIVGFDESHVIVHDPMGEENKKINKEHFEAVFNQMGKQSLYISLK